MTGLKANCWFQVQIKDIYTLMSQERKICAIFIILANVGAYAVPT